MNTTATDAAATCTAILDAVSTVIVGKRGALELVLSGLVCGGHVLLEDTPGVGKTLLARTFAQATGLSVGRIQFTPDLMPADVTGSMLFDQKNSVFEFRPGPIFHNLVIGDEINRAPPKTQAAMLEAMQERQVSVDGVTHQLPSPFLVLATQNPIEFEGTYPLPEAQVDRFLLRTSLGYPTPEEDAQIVRRRLDRRRDDVHVEPVVGLDEVRALQTVVEDVEVSEPVIDYAVALVHATRASPSLDVGASPRGVDALVKLARARALLAARSFVTPDDIKAVAVVALAHRVVLRPELWVRNVSAESVIETVLTEVATPTTLPAAATTEPVPPSPPTT